jgi:hypothetical protein
VTGSRSARFGSAARVDGGDHVGVGVAEQFREFAGARFRCWRWLRLECGLGGAAGDLAGLHERLEHEAEFGHVPDGLEWRLGDDFPVAEPARARVFAVELGGEL